MRIGFGDWILDAQLFLLERAGRRVPLRPKVFDLLIHLVRHRERVVPRDELAQLLWGQTAVGGGSLSGLVNELRNALEESGAGDSSIRTVHARGYQFIGEVVPARPEDDASHSAAAFSIGHGSSTEDRRIDDPNRHRNARSLLGELSASRSRLLQFGFSRFVSEEVRPTIDAEGIAPVSDSELRSLFWELLQFEEKRSRQRTDDMGEENSLRPDRRMRMARSSSERARRGLR